MIPGVLLLLVEVYIDKSPIHGIGVFSAAPIPKGAEVWRFTKGLDLDLPTEILEEQPPVLNKKLRHYGYIDTRLNRFILCCDDARFMNHSDNPNLYTDYSMDKYGVDFAIRDIKAGEELTIDYSSFEDTAKAGRFK